MRMSISRTASVGSTHCYVENDMYMTSTIDIDKNPVTYSVIRRYCALGTYPIYIRLPGGTLVAPPLIWPAPLNSEKSG